MHKRLGQPWPIDPTSGRGLVHEAVTMRRAAVCNDIGAIQEQLRFGPELVKAGHRAGIVLPVIVDGKATAVFGLYTSEVGLLQRRRDQAAARARETRCRSRSITS